MSMCVCDRCSRYIDSDEDPDCFVGPDRIDTRAHIWCEQCREKEAAYWDRVDEGRQRAKDRDI